MTAVRGKAPADSALRMGLALLGAGNARGACGHFHSALAADPSNAAALRGLVRAKLALNEVADAEDAVRQLARVAPNELLTHEMRARTYLGRGAFPLAATAAEDMIQVAPNNAMGFHLLAAARLAQKRNREAYAAVLEARKLAPTWAILLAQSGWAKLQLKGPYVARPDVEEAFRIAPRDPYVRYVSAVLAMALGQTSRARELCESILRVNVNHRNALELYVLSQGPFPVHRWAARWTYLCRAAGPFSWLLRGLGVLVYMAIVVGLGMGTAGGAWIVLIVLRIWIAREKKERANRVRRHFAAPTVNI
jgi:tetratricopeptide (TPR) repeat protein